MKIVILVISVLISTTGFAKSVQEQQNLDAAIELLRQVSQESDWYQVTPDTDAAVMVKNLALKTGEVEDEYDLNFSRRNDEAWEADTSAWGLATPDEVYEYFLDGIKTVIQYKLDREEDVTGLKEKMTSQIHKAFDLLDKVKSVKYGVGPLGGEQCGVRFPAVFVMDTETGDIQSFSMDGSGC